MCKTKVCIKCKFPYEDIVNNFYKNGSYYKTICKNCEKNADKVYRESHKRSVVISKERYQVYKERYKNRDRKKYEGRYNEKIKIRSKEKVIALKDVYVKTCLRTHMKNDLINLTPELVDAYRQLMLFRREKKQLSNLIKSLKNGSSINL